MAIAPGTVLTTGGWSRSGWCSLKVGPGDGDAAMSVAICAVEQRRRPRPEPLGDEGRDVGVAAVLEGRAADDREAAAGRSGVAREAEAVHPAERPAQVRDPDRVEVGRAVAVDVDAALDDANELHQVGHGLHLSVVRSGQEGAGAREALDAPIARRRSGRRRARRPGRHAPGRRRAGASGSRPGRSRGRRC